MIVNRKEARRVGRNALYAAGVRVVIGLLKSLLKQGLSSRLLGEIVSQIFSLDPLKWGAFIGGLSCVRIAERSLTTVAPPLAASIGAGLISALPVVVFQRSTQTELLLYFLARVVHHGSTNFVLPMLPQAFQDFSHYDVLTMMVTSAQILYTFVFLPKCHLPSYQGFLLRATMTDSRVLAATAAAHLKTPCPEGVEFALAKGVTFDSKILDTSRVCELYHPGQSCNSNSLGFIVKHFLKITLPLYLPLKAISTAVLHWKKLSSNPLQTTVKCVRSAAKSAAFLTVYCAAAMRIICVFAQLGIRNDVGIAIVVGGVSGATTLIEDKPRRLDLAIYCVMQAIRSTTSLLHHKGFCAIPRRSTQVLLYLGCVAYLFATFSRNPSRTHPTVAKMFTVLSGEEPRKETKGQS